MDAFAGSKCYQCILYWRKYIPKGCGLDEPTGKLIYYGGLCFMS